MPPRKGAFSGSASMSSPESVNANSSAESSCSLISLIFRTIELSAGEPEERAMDVTPLSFAANPAAFNSASESSLARPSLLASLVLAVALERVVHREGGEREHKEPQAREDEIADIDMV